MSVVDYGNSFEMSGRKATLTERVSFDTTINVKTAMDKDYPKGTKVRLSYYQKLSDLYIFTFPCGNEFPIRSSKFEWK